MAEPGMAELLLLAVQKSLNTRTHRWIIAASFLCFVFGVALSHRIEPGFSSSRPFSRTPRKPPVLTRAISLKNSYGRVEKSVTGIGKLCD
jgi:hypothetical protein